MNVSITGVQLKDNGADLSAELILDSVRLALGENAITIDKENCRNIGIFLGTTFSTFYLRNNTFQNYLREGLKALNPTLFPETLLSYLGGYFSIKLSVQGIHSTLSSGSSSGFDALMQGVYFLKNDNKNKAVIIELDEDFGEDLIYTLKGTTCLVIENTASAKAKSSYGNILGTASFFEKEGESLGLSKAIQTTLDKCGLKFTEIDRIFCCGFGSSHLREREAFCNAKGYSQSKLFSLIDKGDISRSAFFLFGNILKKGNLKAVNCAKKSLISLFLNLGCNNNSSCLIFKSPLEEAANAG